MGIKRTCTVIEKSLDCKIVLAVDDDNAAEIINYLKRDERHKKKFNFIVSAIFERKATKEIFRSERIDPSSESVYAMRFFPGQENDRIYCKKIEYEEITFIVMSELMEKKKNQKLKRRERNIINKISGYEYQINYRSDNHGV